MDIRTIYNNAVLGTAFTMTTAAAMLLAAHQRELLVSPVGKITLALWIVWTIIVVSFRPTPLKMFQNRAQIARYGAVCLAVLLVVILAAPWEYIHFENPLPRNGILAWVGIALFAAGDILMLLTMWTLQGYFSEDRSSPATPWIIRNGIYHTIRHPMYSSLLLCLLGISLALSSLAGLGTFVVSTALVIWRIRIEEKRLEEIRRGEYQEYKRQTAWLLLPKVY